MARWSPVVMCALARALLGEVRVRMLLLLDEVLDESLDDMLHIARSDVLLLLLLLDILLDNMLLPLLDRLLLLSQLLPLPSA